MNLQKLVKRVQREAKANPAKAAVLASVTAVALWFWAPLVSGWISSGKSEPAAQAAPQPAAAEVQAPQPVTEAASKDKAEEPPAKWQQVVSRIKADKKMQSAEPVIDGRDPFRVVAAPEAVVQEKKEEPKPTRIDPETLGLVLTGTFIGPSQSVATINGRMYSVAREGRSGGLLGQTSNRVIVDQQGHRIELNLLSVEPTQVILEFQGQTFPLQLKEKKLNGKSTFEARGRASFP